MTKKETIMKDIEKAMEEVKQMAVAKGMTEGKHQAQIKLYETTADALIKKVKGYDGTITKTAMEIAGHQNPLTRLSLYNKIF